MATRLASRKRPRNRVIVLATSTPPAVNTWPVIRRKNVLAVSVAPPVPPLAITVTALTETSVRVDFSAPVVLNSELVELANYVLTGPGSPTVLLVTPEAVAEPNYVVLTTTEHKQGAAYDAEVLRIRAVTDPALTDSYTGIGVAPTMLSAVAETSRSVIVTFSEPMLLTSGLLTALNWTITPDFGSNAVTVTSVQAVGSTGVVATSFRLRLNTDMTTGVTNYNVAVPAATFTDYPGNPQAAPFNLDFDGLGIPAFVLLPATVEKIGGTVVRIDAADTLLPAGKYFITIDGLNAHSTRAGQGFIATSFTRASMPGRTLIRYAAPALPIGTYDVTVTSIDTGLSYTAVAALEIVPFLFQSRTLQLRQKLSRLWQTGFDPANKVEYPQ